MTAESETIDAINKWMDFISIQFGPSEAPL